VLCGANVADEVAREQLCEATLGVAADDGGATARLWAAAFRVRGGRQPPPPAAAAAAAAAAGRPAPPPPPPTPLSPPRPAQTPYLLVDVCADARAVEAFGALKNVVALGAGFVDGLGAGANAKAAVVRRGLLEMAGLAREFFGARDGGDALLRSCGVGDVVASCVGGRNRRCAEAFARTGRPWAELEAELLGGQKLAGVGAAAAVGALLARAGRAGDYPLFARIAAVAAGAEPPGALLRMPQPRD